MSPFDDRTKNSILTAILALLCLLFLVSLFKNISYPLFWADESMTAMGGVRVMEYGYPKVHDGKNVVYDLNHPNPRLGIDEKTDAYIGGASWSQYYFAVPALKLAEMTDDFFTKTAIIRIFFALAGLAGLALLAFLGVQFFGTRLSKKGFLVLFVFFELISVPLVLHLREVRYYSLTLLLTSLALFAYARYRILKTGRYSTYTAVLIVSLLVLFLTFTPVYFIFVLSLGIFESLLLARGLISVKKGAAGPDPSFTPKGVFRDYLKGVAPLIISGVMVLPLLSYFRTFYIGREMADLNAYLYGVTKSQMYSWNLFLIWRYFAQEDFIYLAICLKAFLVLFFLGGLIWKTLPSPDRQKFVLSNFLTLFFLVYMVSIARIPNFPFTRYFIPILPVLALIIILDIATIYGFVSRFRPSAARYGKITLALVFAGFVAYNISWNAKYLEGHVYEVSHQYKGPLDYLIPYIKDRYKNTDKLVIATNYEETSFMYYLNSRVTIGFVGNNLEEDSRTIPDVIVSRARWAKFGKFGDILSNFRESGHYEEISFPVVDYPVNNIPELNWHAIHHQFRTLETADAEKRLDIYVKE